MTTRRDVTLLKTLSLKITVWIFLTSRTTGDSGFLTLLKRFLAINAKPQLLSLDASVVGS